MLNRCFFKLIKKCTNHKLFLYTIPSRILSPPPQSQTTRLRRRADPHIPNTSSPYGGEPHHRWGYENGNTSPTKLKMLHARQRTAGFLGDREPEARHSRLLLLRAGDIEETPGPNHCGWCKDLVKEANYLSCKNCETKFHMKRFCSGL